MPLLGVVHRVWTRTSQILPSHWTVKFSRSLLIGGFVRATVHEGFSVFFHIILHGNNLKAFILVTFDQVQTVIKMPSGDSDWTVYKLNSWVLPMNVKTTIAIEN